MRASGNSYFWSEAARPLKDCSIFSGLTPDAPGEGACVYTVRAYTIPEMIPIHESASGISFAIKVHPRAKKAEIMGELGDALKVAITAAPVEGKANAACSEFFAKLLKVPRSSVTIAAGQSSRNKVIRIAGITAAEFREYVRF